MMLTPIVATGGETSSLSNITTAMTNGFTSIVSDMMSSIGSILPIILPVVGAVAVITIGIKIFRRFAK